MTVFEVSFFGILILSRVTFKNGQTYFKNLAAFTWQAFKSLFGHFSIVYTKRLSRFIEAEGIHK